VVRFVNQIIRRGLEQRATDIHVEPQQDRLRIRYRIDGRLEELTVPDNIKSLQASVIARLKIMARLDIAERRLPQDGRINLEMDGLAIDVRVATIPSTGGVEDVVMRILAGGEPIPLDVVNAETGEIMSPLAAFLTHASLEAGDNQAQAGADAIQLMTVHSAKGLEFDAVFITGIEEGLFPHEQSLADADGVEEERRLMYVAITRARKRLYLSFSQTRLLHGQTRYNVKSRFFDELPDASLKWITPRQQGFGSGYAREYQQAWQRGSGLSGIVGAGRVAPPRSVPPPAPFAAPAAGGDGTLDLDFADALKALPAGQVVGLPQ
jgi:hypothetical protein